MTRYSNTFTSKSLLICSILMISSTINTAYSQDKNDEKVSAPQKGYSISAETGYRKDNLEWSISGFDTVIFDPETSQYFAVPTSSTLTWENIKILETKIEGDAPIARIKDGDLFISGSIAHGVIFGGDNQDSDYFGNNQELEFSRSNNKASSGSTEDYSVALSYKLYPQNIHFLANKTDSYTITPTIGYSMSKQNLRMTDGVQTINAFDPSTEGSPIPGLNSSYDTSWQGAYVGLTLGGSIADKHNLEIMGQLHFADYYAEADWNLRSDFAHPKSFEHEADATGQVFNIKYGYKPGENLTYTISYNYKKFTTDAGTDTTFFSNGDSTSVRLDKVDWDSQAFKVGLNYAF